MGLRVAAILTLPFTAFNAWAHPGHSTLNSNHTHDSLTADPVFALILGALAVVAIVAARPAIVRRLRIKK
jgi:hypothetical protein